jgi:DNA mismatch repair ATPase MutS
VSPGTVVEDRILGGPEHSFLASLVEPANGVGGFAAVDITTGEWYHGIGDGPGTDGLLSAVAPFQPREILWASGGPPARTTHLSRVLAREFRSARIEGAPDPVLEAEVPAPLRSATDLDTVVADADRRLIAYLRVAQPRILPHLILVERGRAGRRLVLDPKTLRHLEVRRPMNPDDPDGATLLSAWDATVTASGSGSGRTRSKRLSTTERVSPPSANVSLTSATWPGSLPASRVVGCDPPSSARSGRGSSRSGNCRRSFRRRARPRHSEPSPRRSFRPPT